MLYYDAGPGIPDPARYRFKVLRKNIQGQLFQLIRV
jgi:hypothetical protein